MFDEADLLPISALQHLAFCERQWGLIHLEQVWAENVLTAQGRLMHDRAHDAGTELRGDILTSRGVRLRSLRLGLSGVADVVEFHRVERNASTTASPPLIADNPPPITDHCPPLTDHGPPLTAHCPLPSRPGLWRPIPVEYKRGKPKSNHCDEVQLCAQALCLEEMLGVTIPEGFLFYGQPRRRTTVPFDAPLRTQTESLTARMHALFNAGVTPPGVHEKKCKSCSLFELCRPQSIKSTHSAIRYLSREISALADEIE